jgi:ribosomal protein L11 methyltransferase
MSDNSDWYAVEVLCPSDAVDAVESALDILGAEGIETDSLGRKNSPEQKVIGYFNDPPGETEVESTICEAAENFGVGQNAKLSISVRKVENEDWLAEWKKNWKPTVTGRFIVAPAWQEVDAGDRLVIRIDPSMAFGTGTHETTRRCLKSIESNYCLGESFLDVGTGTGILAIAAAMLHPNSANVAFYGCDTDEDSIKIARENADLNGVSHIVFEESVLGDEVPRHDFTCANLTADVILPILELLIAKTKRILVLSGILVEQEKSVTNALEANRITDYHVERDGEWIGITVRLGS